MAGCLTAIVTIVPFHARGAVLYVGGSGPGNYTTIQAAIDVANPGDTVFIYNGTYYEHVAVNKTLSIVGENKEDTVISGGWTGNVMAISAEWVNVTGLTIAESGQTLSLAGIVLSGANMSRLVNNSIIGNRYGIHAVNTVNVSIEGNEVEGNVIGVMLSNSDNTTVLNNTFRFNGDGLYMDASGLYLASSNNANVSGNRFLSQTGNGVYAMDSENGTVRGNEFSSSLLYGVQIFRSRHFTIQNNTIERCQRGGVYLYSADMNSLVNNSMDRNGVIIYFSKGVTMIGNSLTETVISMTSASSSNDVSYWNTHNISTSNKVNGRPVRYWKNMTGGVVPIGAGEVILANVSDVRIENQTDVRGGFEVGYSHGITIANVSISSDANVLLEHSDNSTIHNLTVDYAGQYGIYLSYSDSTAISSASIGNAAYAGIFIYYTKNTTVLNSSIAHCDRGIYGYPALGVNFTGNNVSSNTDDGIFIYGQAKAIAMNNTVLSNGVYGIYAGGPGSVVTGNTVRGGAYGITTSGQNLLLADNNVSYQSGVGLSVSSASGGKIVWNRVAHSSYGIYAYSQSSGTIANNTLTNNSVGIGLSQSSSNSIVDNKVSHSNSNGLYAKYASSNTIARNRFTGNERGVNLTASSTNSVYHNYFENNSLQAFGGDANNWDNGYPSGGNYWSDYTGGDGYRGPEQDILGSDGIGDIPYLIIGGTRKDRYPLMYPPGPWRPSAPRNLTAVRGDMFVNLTWEPPYSDGGMAVENYTLYRGMSSGSELPWVELGNVTWHNDTGLINGLKYYYRVAARNDIGEGPQSNEASATPGTNPTAPMSLTASKGDHSVLLNWMAPVSNGGLRITNYRIYRGNAPGTETFLTQVGNVTSYLNTALTNGLTYFYAVTAKNEVGEGPQSNEANATPAAVPSPPTLTSAVPGNKNVTLSWSTPTDDGGFPVKNYTIYRGTTPDSEIFLVKLGNVLTYLDWGLINGWTYYYKVSATNDIGEGLRSNERFAMPVSIPGGPTGLTAARGNHHVALNWTPPLDNGGCPITNYRIYRGLAPGAESFLAEVGNVYVYDDTGLSNGLTYYYVVAAKNTVGEGTASNEASATPAAMPGPPSLLSAAAGNQTATLMWSAPMDDGGFPVTNYRIYRGTMSGGESFLVEVGNVLTYVDSGLTNGQMYYYRICAKTVIGEGDPSNEMSVVPATIPSSPKLISAVPSYQHVMLAWSTPTDTGGIPLTSFGVYVGDSPGTETLLVYVSSSLSSYDVAGLTNGKTYYFQMTAENAIGESARSNELSAIPAGVPSPPINLYPAPADGSVILSWMPPTDDGGLPILGYNIYRGTASGGENPVARIGPVLNFTDTGLTNGQRYFYKVSASNAFGEGQNSSEVSAVPTGVPGAPTGLVAVAGNRQVTLNWQPPVSDGGSTVLKYRVYRGTSPAGESLLTEIGNVLTYTDTGLTNGQIYYYQVSAMNIGGEGAKSGEASQIPGTVPNRPAGPSVTAGDGQVTLRWAPPTDDGGFAITRYTIYRGTSPGGEIFLVIVGAVLQYVDAGLTNGQIYYYRMSATNALGEGGWTDEVEATPTASVSVPGPPLNLQAFPGNGQILLTWLPPADDGGSPIRHYSVYRGTTAGGEAFLITLGNVLWHIDAGLVNGQPYYYKVKAENLEGEGAESNEASATPSASLAKPSSPNGLTAVAGDRQVTLTWNPPSSDGGSPVIGYRIFIGVIPGGEAFLADIGNVLTFTVGGLSNGQTYFFQVSARNAVGEGPRSDETGAIPAGAGALPGPPIGVAASPGDRSVTLTWSPPVDTGGMPILGYRIFRGTSPGGEALVDTVANVLTYLDDRLTNGVTYYYQVSAVTGAGEGQRSAEVNAAPVNQHPMCTIHAPLQDLTISATYSVVGSSSDLDGQVQAVEVRIDGGGWRSVFGTSQWRFDWDTRGVANGLHTIEARSFDGENYSTAASVTVSVDNQATQSSAESVMSQPWFWVLLVIVILLAFVIILLMSGGRGKEVEEDQPETEEEAADENLEELVEDIE